MVRLCVAKQGRCLDLYQELVPFYALDHALQPTMASTAPKGWTDTEKVSASTSTRDICKAPLTHILQAGLFLQIIAKAGAIPWGELQLPEGRTVKACQVMLDKEKQKVKKAREAAGEDVNADVTSPKVSLSIFHVYLHSLTHVLEAQGG